MIHTQVSGTPLNEAATAWFGAAIDDRTRLLARAENALLDAPRRELGKKVEDIAVHRMMLAHLRAMQVLIGNLEPEC